MKHTHIIDNPREIAAIRESIDVYVSTVDLARGDLFTDHATVFLFFSHLYVTEPHRLKGLLDAGGLKRLYLGHLSEGPVRAVSGDVVSIELGWDEQQIHELLNLNLPHGRIQSFVSYGFAVPDPSEWFIWFSTYWEIAIAAFSSREAAVAFSERQRGIRFMSNQDVIEAYATNPASTAPGLLQTYLSRNLVDRSEPSHPIDLGQV
jgi:hypothetical protein